MSMRDESDFICQVRVGRHNLKISKRTSVTISAFLKGKRYLHNTTAVFQPSEMDSEDDLLEETVVRTDHKCSVKVMVTNRVNQDYVLPRRRLLGSLHRVGTVLQVGSMEDKGLAEVKHADDSQKEKAEVSHPPVDLDLTLLSKEEIRQVRELLSGECHTFTQDDNDIGCAVGLQMPTELNDQMPVHSSYMTLQKTPLQEVKDYVKNLLNKQWSRESTSQCTIPVVCVRKKDGTLRLCMDYRRLNAKPFRTSIQYLVCKML